MTAKSDDRPEGASAEAERPVVLEVKNLSVEFHTETGRVAAVVDESFAIRAGETLALVGESGSGKSVTSLAVIRAPT